jgi:NAD(P)H-flavin reductase
MPTTREAPSVLADGMAPDMLQVRDVWDETEDTFSIELAPAGAAFEFRPGQFNMLYVFGVGEVPISISGDPDQPSRLVHTIRGVGPVTTALRRVHAGDYVGVRGPFGSSWPVGMASGHDIVFVAGGVGLAPLRPAIHHVLNRRDQYGRVVLLYGVRSPRDLLFEEEVSEWRGRFDMDVSVTVDTADRRWRGSVGVVTKLIPRAPFDPHEAMSFVCGPGVMMRYTAEELTKRGVRPDRILLSMERNMKCGIGICGHCQFGPYFVCKDGPKFRYDRIAGLLDVREV